MFAYDVPAQISGAIHNSNLISYEENQFRWAQDQLIAGSIDTVTNTPGQVLFVANTGTEVQVGDTITLTINGKDQTVNIGIWFPVNHCSHYDFPYYEYHQHGSFRPNSPIWSNACHWHE